MDVNKKTLFNGYESDLMDVIQGVPQGSTLGPLLYILYVNDCFHIVKNHKDSIILMYADDTVLISQGENTDEAVARN